MKGLDFVLRGAAVAAFSLILYLLIRIAVATDGEYQVLKETNGVVLGIEITLTALVVIISSIFFWKQTISLWRNK